MTDMTDPLALAAVMPTTRKRRRWPFVAAAVALAALVAFGTWWIVDPGSTAVTGTVTVISEDVVGSGESCTLGEGGYADIKQGASVVISDAEGKTLAIARLGRGHWVYGQACEFPFALDVPSGAEFYGVKVAGRNVVQFVEADLAEPLVLSLGG